MKAVSAVALADPEHGVTFALICNGTPGEKPNHRRTQAVVNAVYDEMELA